jgi:hypothetical protein
MKTLILTLGTLVVSQFLSSQIGVVTLDKGQDYVPMNMWYTIHEKGRKNQMYFTSHDKEDVGEVLDKVLTDLDIPKSDTVGIDEQGSPYWGTDLGNGFYSWVFYSQEDTFFTITILSEEN